MDYVKAILVGALALTALVCADAYAVAPPDDSQGCPAKKPPPKRRAVAQVIVPTPRIAMPLPQRPVLPLAVQPVPPGPVPLNHCDAGGCTDTAGQRYGPGPVTVTPQGKTCLRNGAWVQCN
ncbi:MAG: hypothetical protein V4463_20165 [Pseudomonadota bacterium]